MKQHNQATEEHIKAVSRDSIQAFGGISCKATEKLSEGLADGVGSLAAVQTFTNANAVQNIRVISQKTRQAYEVLTKEPAISRVTARNEHGEDVVYFIARGSAIPVGGEIRLASYGSPIGRLASLPVGDELAVEVAGEVRNLTVLEKVKLNPRKRDGEWDSKLTVFESRKYNAITVDSLLDLLRGRVAEDDEAALLEFLEWGDQSNIRVGIQHEVRAAMALRDQPILDQFQDEIFRLPIDSELLILGPPGTGKTTTLIRRLGQKINREHLDEPERSLIERSDSQGKMHELSWVMFTPTDLLKHFVKEAFNREQVPASDQHIKTWDSHRNDLARRVLGILQSATTRGKFVHKQGLSILREDVFRNPIPWYEKFRDFHGHRMLEQMERGLEILQSSAVLDDNVEEAQIANILASSASLMTVLRALSRIEESLKPLLARMKDDSDTLIRKSLAKLYNKDNDFLHALANFMDSSKDAEDSEDEAEFDDESDPVSESGTSAQMAERAYSQAIRSIARNRFLGRAVPKNSRAARMEEWLGERVPDDDTLHAIGESIFSQNGLRRFVNPQRRFLADIPASYRVFRRQSSRAGEWYECMPPNPRQISSMELDLLVLSSLETARALLAEPYIRDNLNEQRYFTLKGISQSFLNQVLVDEATDFSPLQLACMRNLCQMEIGSFFLCGDFNQRITAWGTRCEVDMTWVAPHLESRSITTVYRQSQKLNEFAHEVLRIFGGDLEARGQLPEDLQHTGVSPVLLEDAGDVDDIAIWLTERAQDVERIVDIGMMPTVAVLVNSEDEVVPMANSLNELLEEVNLRAVACSNGQSLGEGTDVRVFNVRHIKGLEFEAVFFVNVDELERNEPELFGKYFYVGATRAATYFGATCKDRLPVSIEELRPYFCENWQLR